jgi:hypothetical protein
MLIRSISRGLKATCSESSLPASHFCDFTRKISKNGHFWGLAKMARPSVIAKLCLNRGAFTLEAEGF